MFGGKNIDMNLVYNFIFLLGLIALTIGVFCISIKNRKLIKENKELKEQVKKLSGKI